MSQYEYIKKLAQGSLENDQEQVKTVLNELIAHAKKTKKPNFALQLQSILKDALKKEQSSGSTLSVASQASQTALPEDDPGVREFILEKLTSEYRFQDLVATPKVKGELQYFVQEHEAIDTLQNFDLPVSNKVMFYGPSGCGKTLASYVLAGELNKLMIVLNLGAIVSSKLGETSKNLSKIFRRVAQEECIVFIDEFDSIGKLRDYSQDHGEMKRVVNTLLQLLDYLPQRSIVIAATNHEDMVDNAILRRFDYNVRFELPDKTRIEELIKHTLKSGRFKLDGKVSKQTIINQSIGLSYFTIQKTLITAIKRSIFNKDIDPNADQISISSRIWYDLVCQEKKADQ
jgi:AAA+ superfamily predicted ATPase